MTITDRIKAAKARMATLDAEITRRDAEPLDLPENNTDDLEREYEEMLATVAMLKVELATAT